MQTALLRRIFNPTTVLLESSGTKMVAGNTSGGSSSRLQQQQQDEEESVVVILPEASSINWMRLQHATLTNMLGIFQAVNGAAGAASSPANPPVSIRSCLKALAQSLQVFRSILSSGGRSAAQQQEPTSPFGWVVDSKGHQAKVRISFYGPQYYVATSSAIETSSGHYMFNYYIAYHPIDVSSSDGAASMEECPRETTQEQRRQDPQQPQEDLDSEWCRPTSLTALVGYTTFNMAISLHKQGILASNSRNLLRKASKLYDSSIELFESAQNDQARLEDTAGSGVTSSSSSSTTKLLVLVQIAAWNNRSHIHYYQGEFEQSQWCLQQVALLAASAASTPFSNIVVLVPEEYTSRTIGAPLVAARTSDHNSVVARELRYGSLLNVRLLLRRKEHHPAAAA